MRYKLLSALIIGCFLTPLWALKVNLDPPRHEVIMKAGDTVKKTLNLTNMGNSSIKVKVYLNDWVLDKGNKVFMPAGSTGHSLSSYVSIFPTAFILRARESKSIFVTITSKETDTDGSYGVVFCEAYPEKGTQSTGAQIGGRIGSIIYREIEGKSHHVYEADVLKCSLIGNKLYVKYNVRNKGNVLARPQGTVVLMNDQTNEIYFKGELSKIIVLPGGEFYHTDLLSIPDVNVDKKNLKVLVTFSYGEDILLKECEVN